MDSSERGLKIRGEKRGIEVSKSETDFVLQNWTKSNWATFVSAAPLAIESLGGLLLTSSGLIDFNIVSNLTPEQAKSFFPLTKAPSTFKAALLDVSVAAKDAFFNAQSNMDTIGLTTRSLRDDVFQNVINILRRPDPERIRKLLPKRIALMLELTAKCEKAAKNSEENFEALAVLTRELRLATLQKGVTNRAELDQINRSLAYTGEILTGERLQLESLEADAKKANERIKTAEKDLTKAFDDFPPHSTLIKYFLLDAGVMFGKFAIGAIFPVVGAGMAFNELKKKLNKKDDDDSDSENDKDDKSTFDTVDPNLVISRKLLIAAKMTGVLLGLEGSTVDWDRIVTDSSAGKGVGYIVQKMVAESLTSLAAETQTDLGQEVKEQGDILSKLVDDVLKLATTTKSASDVAGLRVKNDGVIDSLESLDPATSGITQSSKAQKKSKSGSLYGEQAIDSALWKLRQQGRVLENAHRRGWKIQSSIEDQQEKINTTLIEVSSLIQDQNDFEAIKRAVDLLSGSFLEITVSFMRLASFFKNMTNLITLSLEPAIGRLNDTLTLGIKDAAEGLPISNPVIESIHRLTASPSMYMLLAEIIAKTYYNISKELIMPMASCLDQMLLLRKQDKVAFAREVDEKRTELKSVTYKAAEQIKAIIAQETANWSSKVNLRLKEIDDDVKRLLPVGESGDNVITEGDDKEDDAVMGLVKLAFFS